MKGRGRIETSRVYAIEPGGPMRLELRWDASFREVRLLLDGAQIALLDKKSLRGDGAKVTLEDGSVLSVRLRGLLGIELHRGGVPLPGSDLDPRRLLRNAAILMVVAALANAVTDGLLFRRATAAAAVEMGAPLSRTAILPLILDGALLFMAAPTLLGSRIALAVGIAAFASRFGLSNSERSTWTLIYGVLTTWLLATHFFGTFRRR